MKLCEKSQIRRYFSTPYYPKSSGQAEATNKTIIRLLKKTVSQNKRGWHEKLEEVLWAYRTSFRTSTGATPYALTYGSEDPVEMQYPSLRIALCEAEGEAATLRRRVAELSWTNVGSKPNNGDFFIRPDGRTKRKFDIGSLRKVLKARLPIRRRNEGKFQPEGPFVIHEVYPLGAYRLANANGEFLPDKMNGHWLKAYFP